MLPKIIKPSVTRNQTMCSFTFIYVRGMEENSNWVRARSGRGRRFDAKMTKSYRRQLKTRLTPLSKTISPLLFLFLSIITRGFSQLNLLFYAFYSDYLYSSPLSPHLWNFITYVKQVYENSKTCRDVLLTKNLF